MGNAKYDFIKDLIEYESRTTNEVVRAYLRAFIWTMNNEGTPFINKLVGMVVASIYRENITTVDHADQRILQALNDANRTMAERL